MKELLTLKNFKECRKQRCFPRIMLFQTILDFDNKLKEGTKHFNELFRV